MGSERVVCIMLAVYSVALTFRAAIQPRMSSLCSRDFVEPTQPGSCLCGEGEFCLCTPSLAADVLIELENADGVVDKIVLIERKDGRGLAMVGGFVKVGESAEDAAAREALEETGLRIKGLKQWCLFSQPRRDPRRHTAALVFVARARGQPRAADDAKGIRVVPLAELARSPPQFAFDHGDIVGAYMVRFHRKLHDTPPRLRSPSASAIDRACRAG
jgi:8-oxo-dGTP diphosphatase